MQFHEWKIQEVQYGIVGRCNLMCRGCSHMTPLQPEYFVPVDEFRTNLGILLKAMPNLDELSLTGGETLLHPELDALMKIVKELAPKTRLEIITNGVLIPKMSENFWSMVDKLYISCYPSQKAPDIPKSDRKIEVIHRTTGSFFESCSVRKNPNEKMVDYLWNHCWLRRGCVIIFGNYFFQCARSAYMAKVLATEATDGIPMQDLTEERLIEFFKRKPALDMCSFCTGADGLYFGHAQVPNKVAWKAVQDRDLRDMIDIDVIHKCEDGK
jgi:hypothetical protein